MVRRWLSMPVVYHGNRWNGLAQWHIFSVVVHRRHSSCLSDCLTNGARGRVHICVAARPAAHRGYTAPGGMAPTPRDSVKERVVMPRKNDNARKPRRSRGLHAVPEAATDQAERVRTAAEDKLWAALRANPQSTTSELSTEAGIGKSTAGKILAAWNTDGSVNRTSGMGDGGRRAADRWTIIDADTDEHAPAEATVAEVVAAEEPSPIDGDEAGGEVADAIESPIGTAMEPTDEVPAEDNGTEKESTVDADVPKPSTESESDTNADAGGAEVEVGKASRLGKGELRGMVEDYLRDHKGEEFGPTAIGKALNRSSGAVNNAMEKLVAEGYAVQTQATPKRFALKAETDESAS